MSFRLACAFISGLACAAPANELYPPLFGYDARGAPPQPLAADPLVTFTWGSSVNVTSMQRYDAPPVSVSALPASCVVNAASLVASKTAANATFVEYGQLILDFGVERAAWFEFASPNLASVLAAGGVIVKASLSEYAEPWTHKTRAVVAYDGGLFRLETNTPELYEGLRFAWIMYEREAGGSAPALPWTITSARAVAQVKPVNYTAGFSSSSTLTSVWFTGAYGSRLNMHESYFGSILMDRGDRVSIQGDGHPTMAAALAAFASPEVHRLVHVMLKATDSGCKGCSVVDDSIMEYPVLWTLSVRDWLFSSGDTLKFLSDFADDVAHILDSASASFLTNPSLNLMGWDDRLGNGWCFSDRPCGREPQLTFAALLVMAVQEFAASLAAAGDTARAAQYNASAHDMVARLRATVRLDDASLGVHSASMLLNVAGLATPTEVSALLSTYLNDATSICSWSPFNSYWILQGLGNAGVLDRAADMAELCWGGMTRLAPGCFWELFSPMWEPLLVRGDKAPTRPSYCHPWADGVTAWLSRTLGGINPRSPGFVDGFFATPHVSAARPHVTARATTPSGAVIDVHATRTGATRTVVVDARETPGVVGIPVCDADEGSACVCALLRLVVDGSEVPRETLSEVALRGAAHFRRALARTHVFTPTLTPGQPHTVTGVYACAEAARASAFPPIAWKALAWSVDTTTHGLWRGKLGADGYALFAFVVDAAGKPASLEALPPYASSVVIVKGDYETIDTTCLGANDTAPAFLQDPRGDATAPRRLGFATSGGDGSQGIVVDVNMTHAGPGTSQRTVSFYVSSVQQPSAAVDPYQGPPSMVARVMDLDTLDPIAPDTRFDDFDAGTWYSVTICCGCGRATAWCGVRVRFMQIDGTNTVSAVVFGGA